ncbi:MAG: hypothetical protein ABIJ96_07425 [Elusimicrobiota bacterium]
MTRLAMIAVFFASVWTLPGTVFGEGKEEGREGQKKQPEILSEKYLERLDKQLRLEDEQKKKIQAILKEATPGLKTNWQEAQKLQQRMKDLREKMQKLMRDTQEKIRTQLDAEQKDKYDELRVRMRQRMQGRRGEQAPGQQGGRRGGPGMAPGGERNPSEFPPEHWEQRPMPERDQLPPELIERIKQRRQRRQRMQPGSQRDVPESGEWDDRNRGLFNDPPTP